MATKLNLQEGYYAAYRKAQAHPPKLPSNPDKLAEARRYLTLTLETARTALEYERQPVMCSRCDPPRDCLTPLRRRCTRWFLAWNLSGMRSSVPGLESGGLSDLLTPFFNAVRVELTPSIYSPLHLPRGGAMIAQLIEVLECTLRLIEEKLAACEVAHG